MRFGDPGNPVKEECKWRNTNLLSSPVVFWGQRGWVLGLQFRDWRVGGGQNHHTGLTRGHIRDGRLEPPNGDNTDFDPPQKAYVVGDPEMAAEPTGLKFTDV